MIPSLLENRWAQVAGQLTDVGARFDLDWPTFWASLDTPQQERLQRVLCVSQYVVDALPKEAGFFTQWIASDAISQPLPRAHIRAWLNDVATDAVSEEDWQKALRIVRRRAMVHIIWRDLLRLADTLTTTRSVSDLADECVCRSIDFLTPILQRRHGVPIGKHNQQEQQLLVLGMGKLGAYELNLSSDIDLIFTYPEGGDTTGPKVISNQEYFIKLGQKLITALDKNTIDGFVFRTDMRLRPYGQSGPLVMNFDALEEYYQSQGRDWERYAMVKARVMNGEQSDAGQRLLHILRPFTYRVYIDYSAFESLRSMKAMINAEVRRRHLNDNVKLGAGGIREIEFIVQAFQLIRGGQDTQLQRRELVPMLSILASEGYLPPDAATELDSAYRFLRDSEHALQALNDDQTQQLPGTDLEQARVALAMGFDHWSDYLPELDRHRQAVKHHFREIVRGQDNREDNTTAEHCWIDLWHGELSNTSQADLANHNPILISPDFAQRLETFRDSKAVATMQPIGRDRLEVLMPQLLSALADSPEPLVTLERLIPMLESVLRRTAYLVLLKENPQALKQLITLCGASIWVAEYITRTPLLLDELLSPATLYQKPERALLEEELHLRLLRIDEDDLEQQMEQLRQFVRAHKLRAAACEVMDALPLMQISDYLTYLAEIVLKAVMQLAWQQMAEKYGYPQGKDKQPVLEPEFLIIGYGKVGGLELSYSSDLDLVFLHNTWNMGSTLADKHAGQRSIDNPVFYTRMGQRMIHILTTQTRSGDLYEIDLRLRPSGNSGMIVASLKAFEEYQKQHAWTWEHQALIRARVLCGQSALANAYEIVRARTLEKSRDLTTLRHDVRVMRQKMRDNLGSKSTNGQQFHLKHDAGGIVDIEFLVQYGVLAWSHQHPELLAVTDNMRLLDAFAAAGLLDPQDQQTLQQTYLSYRAETHRRALQNQRVTLDKNDAQRLGFDQTRRDVTRLWQQWLDN